MFFFFFTPTTGSVCWSPAEAQVHFLTAGSPVWQYRVTNTAGNVGVCVQLVRDVFLVCGLQLFQRSR